MLKSYITGRFSLWYVFLFNVWEVTHRYSGPRLKPVCYFYSFSFPWGVSLLPFDVFSFFCCLPFRRNSHVLVYLIFSHNWMLTKIACICNYPLFRYPLYPSSTVCNIPNILFPNFCHNGPKLLGQNSLSNRCNIVKYFIINM